MVFTRIYIIRNLMKNKSHIDGFFFLILYNIYGDIMDNQIIVVEGIHDQMRILSLFPNSHVVITYGREISKETINMLKTLTQNNEIILFLDPDGPGEK